jgi:xanthine dehydrogenase accessory factor
MSGSSLTDGLPALLSGESCVAMATLVDATGSTSKKVGAKMFVGASGRILGGVTIGGCIDARVLEAADEIVRTPSVERRLLEISLDDDEAWEIGLTCGGRVDVLVERISADLADGADGADPVLAAYERVADALRRGDSAVVATRMDGDRARLVITPDGGAGTLGDSALNAAVAARATELLVKGASGVETIDRHRVYFERQVPPVTLVIVGAGQIAMSMSRFARELEMRSVIVDGRERYATRARFPDADEVHVGMPSEIVARIAPTKSVAVVLVAHDYKYELPILRNVLRAPVGYIGLLGSKKRGAAVRQMLREEGFTDEELARIHSPIGLNIGGNTGAEIALSILAEIIAVRAGKRSGVAV